MEKLLRKRAMAIALTMALSMVLIMGMAVIAEEEPPLAEPTVNVTDTFAPETDGNAYVGDTFHFTVDGYDAPHNNSNISAEIDIGGNVFDMEWNATEGYWEYHFNPTDPALVGTHMVNVTVMDINNVTNMNYADDLEITIWHPVMAVEPVDLPLFMEDETTTWNLSAAFIPEMDQAGNMLEFGVGPEGFPDGWTFTPMDHMGYTHWNVTPAENFTGIQEVNVTATDTNGEMDSYMFEIDVQPVNDPPVVNMIEFEDMEYMPEWINVTDLLNVSGVMGDFSWLVELEIMEDQMDVNFSVNASDVETEDVNLTYDVVEVTDGLAVEAWTDMPHMFNVSIDENMNGNFLANVTVEDDATDPLVGYVWVLFDVEPVNDPPTAEGDWEDSYMIKTEEEINVSVINKADVDEEDEVTVMWYIDGSMVSEWEKDYFLYSWDSEGTYNVSAKITDGTTEVDVGYFEVTVEVANTAPVISSITVYPKDFDVGDALGFLDREVEEGKDIELTCIATDAEGDELTYTWTHDQDPEWNANGDVVIVSADDLEVDKDYTFTCTVSDGTEEVSDSADPITIVEETDTSGILAACGGIMALIIGVPILLIILIIIIVIVVKKKKGGEEPEEPSMGAEEGMAPEDEGMPGEGMEQQPMEGQMPGMEQQPAPEQQPMEGQMPGMEQQPAPEQQPMEGQMPGMEQQQPAPEQQPMEGQMPGMEQQPAPEQPPAAPEQPTQEQPVPPQPQAPEQQPPAPEQPPAAPQQPQPPQPPQEEQQQ